MLLKIFLVLVTLITVSLVVHNYINMVIGRPLEIVDITDEDVAIGSGEVNENGELIISDSDMNKLNVAVPTVKEGSRELINHKDGTTTIIAFDGFGNKTETKIFNDHPRIKMIKVRTSTTGDKRVFVYSQTGIVENVDQNMLHTVLDTSPDKVANAVGIYETREDKERRATEKLQARKERVRQDQMRDLSEIRESLPNPDLRESSPTTNKLQETDKSVQEVQEEDDEE